MVHKIPARYGTSDKDCWMEWMNERMNKKFLLHSLLLIHIMPVWVFGLTAYHCSSCSNIFEHLLNVRSLFISLWALFNLILTMVFNYRQTSFYCAWLYSALQTLPLFTKWKFVATLHWAHLSAPFFLNNVHSVSLCHILVIIVISQTFSSILYFF